MKKHSPDIFRTNFFGEKFVIICGPSGHKFLFSNEDKHFTVYLPKAIQKLFFSTQQNTDNDLSNDEMKLPQFLAFILGPEALVKYEAGMDSIIQKQLKTHLEGKAEVKMTLASLLSGHRKPRTGRETCLSIQQGNPRDAHSSIEHPRDRVLPCYQSHRGDSQGARGCHSGEESSSGFGGAYSGHVYGDDRLRDVG
ncbi:hypothetical protein RHGRI_005641 [Rhododendron griersonianum]|uniref:Uncharacterized protein n=1 Tax=Rhododendron griersonianum TaxID=479676 RepID=A0AAV6LDZ1_9ERIC|nr:hypothetical protein RHGRI_005641 [Rhododendron griersonianum]